MAKKKNDTPKLPASVTTIRELFDQSLTEMDNLIDSFHLDAQHLVNEFARKLLEVKQRAAAQMIAAEHRMAADAEIIALERQTRREMQRSIEHYGSVLRKTTEVLDNESDKFAVAARNAEELEKASRDVPEKASRDVPEDEGDDDDPSGQHPELADHLAQALNLPPEDQVPKILTAPRADRAVSPNVRQVMLDVIRGGAARRIKPSLRTA